MFPHNSQLTLTLEHPERPIQLYFPPCQKLGSGSKAPGPEPSSMIKLERAIVERRGWRKEVGEMREIEGHPEHTLGGFKADVDMAVVITQRLLLPTLPHLCPAKCRHTAGRGLAAWEERGGRHQRERVKDTVLFNPTNLALPCYCGQKNLIIIFFFFLRSINQHLFYPRVKLDLTAR
ncbi:uncharacterized protein V6R79_006425 [Siganus canaliculatus]